MHEDDTSFFVQQLGASEAHRYVRFKRRERQRQFLLARILLRLVVSSLAALPPDAIGIVERTGRCTAACSSRLTELAAEF